MAIKYSFTTQWEANASRKEVWDAILNPLQWPLWWKDFTEAEEIKSGDISGIGRKIKFTLKSPAHYKLRFNVELKERVEYQLLIGKATGDLEGTGKWIFDEHNGQTNVECHWDVTTNIGWMNALSFLLKPIFAHSHKIVIKNGAHYLALRLGKNVTVSN